MFLLDLREYQGFPQILIHFKNKHMKSSETGSQNAGYNWGEERGPIGASVAGDVPLLVLGVLILW